MRPFVARAAVVVAVPLLLWAGCAVYSADLLDASSDAGGDAGADVTDSGPTGCGHARPPARPSADDPGGADTEFVTVVTALDFGLDAGASRSFDLDDRCTCPDQESCKPEPGAPKHCDDDAGRDNAGGPLLAKFTALSSQFDPSGVNARISNGGNTLMFRVRHWNGLPNDTSVELAVFISRGTLPLDDAGVGPIPKHDGTDQWAIDSASVVGGVAPPYVPTYSDVNAYVVGGVLIATLDFPLSLGGGYANSFFSLSGARVAGLLDKLAAGYHLKDARVVGRWGSRSLLTSMQVAQDPLNKNEYLCGKNLTYQTLKSEICKAADLATTPQNDNTGAACDAMSLVLSFQSEPAQLGPVATSAYDGGALTPCGPSYTDQCGQ